MLYVRKTPEQEEFTKKRWPINDLCRCVSNIADVCTDMSASEEGPYKSMPEMTFDIHIYVRETPEQEEFTKKGWLINDLCRRVSDVCTDMSVSREGPYKSMPEMTFHIYLYVRGTPEQEEFTKKRWLINDLCPHARLLHPCNSSTNKRLNMQTHTHTLSMHPMHEPEEPSFEGELAGDSSNRGRPVARMFCS